MIKKYLFLLLLFAVTVPAFAKFVQEVELVDVTILVGYIYKQRPGKNVIVHVDKTRKDKKARFRTKDKKYTLTWNEIKFIRRVYDEVAPWCQDKITLKNGKQYTGIITQQEMGVSVSIQTDSALHALVIPNESLRQTEKVCNSLDQDLWIDRPYTNRILMVDNTMYEGLIVAQYYGEKKGDNYLELLQNKGFRRRIYMVDVKEYGIILK